MTDNKDLNDFPDEIVAHVVDFCTQEIGALEKFALDHYEEGGHWVVETYDPEDYARVLLAAGDHDTDDQMMETAKRLLRRDWEHMVMLEREYAYGDE